MEETHGNESYCSNEALLPSDLSLTLQPINSSKSVSKAKSTYWFRGKETHFDSAENGSLEEDETQTQRQLILKMLFGQFLKGRTLNYIKAIYIFCSIFFKSNLQIANMDG